MCEPQTAYDRPSSEVDLILCGGRGAFQVLRGQRAGQRSTCSRCRDPAKDRRIDIDARTGGGRHRQGGLVQFLLVVLGAQVELVAQPAPRLNARERSDHRIDAARGVRLPGRDTGPGAHGLARQGIAVEQVLDRCGSALQVGQVQCEPGVRAQCHVAVQVDDAVVGGGVAKRLTELPASRHVHRPTTQSGDAKVRLVGLVRGLDVGTQVVAVAIALGHAEPHAIESIAHMTPLADLRTRGREPHGKFLFGRQHAIEIDRGLASAVAARA